jgi:hypothetical protein
LVKRAAQLDWDAIARAGDCGASAQRPMVPAAKRKRGRALTIIMLLAWLAWEARGAMFALQVGPPTIEAIWKAGS